MTFDELPERWTPDRMYEAGFTDGWAAREQAEQDATAIVRPCVTSVRRWRPLFGSTLGRKR